MTSHLNVSSTFQILFYALRPGLVRSQRPTFWHFLNILVQVAFDCALITLVPGGKHMLVYFIMSSFWAGSLHPLAGHFIAEHYVWDGLEQETYSYYGWLNVFAYNVSVLHILVLRSLIKLARRWAITTSITTSHQCPGRACRPSVPSRPNSTTCSLAIPRGR